MITQIRQGDVLLIKRSEPHRKEKVEARGLRVAGERTGHAHVLEAEVFETERGRMLYVGPGGVITHEEHGQLPVEPGWWEPRIQREFVPSSRPVSRAKFD